MKHSSRCLLSLLVVVSACSSSGPGPLADAGADGAPGRLMEGHCVIGADEFLAQDELCRRTYAQTLNEIDGHCAAMDRTAPVIARCPGRVTIGFIDSQIGIGLRCTYDQQTGAFVGGSQSTDFMPPYCSGTSYQLEVEGHVEDCPIGAQDARYCGPGIFGQATEPGPSRPVRFRLQNQSGRSILLPDPIGRWPSWQIFSADKQLASHWVPNVCQCPNRHCILGPYTSDLIVNVNLAPGQELSWSWDGRLWDRVYDIGSFHACQQTSLAPDGALAVQVSYDADQDGSGRESRTVRATFDNPTMDEVVIVAR